MTTEDLDNFSTLKRIIARLRGKDGCPWDKEQTHTSLKPNLLEECYEVLEALDEGVAPKLSEELGDLLMQVVLHAQIASESGEFTIEDVVRNINTKLIHRHPHIFGELKAKDAAEVSARWEALKQEERPKDASLLDSLPRQMPALAYSQSLQRRVAGIGFDWKEIEGVIDKLAEEVGELQKATSQEQREEEFGDLLFTLANIARWRGVDLESALRQANHRFHRRFSYMEELCRQRGIVLGELSFEEQDLLWEEAKAKTNLRKGGKGTSPPCNNAP